MVMQSLTRDREQPWTTRSTSARRQGTVCGLPLVPIRSISREHARLACGYRTRARGAKHDQKSWKLTVSVHKLEDPPRRWLTPGTCCVAMAMACGMGMRAHAAAAALGARLAVVVSPDIKYHVLCQAHGLS